MVEKRIDVAEKRIDVEQLLRPSPLAQPRGRGAGGSGSGSVGSNSGEGGRRSRRASSKSPGPADPAERLEQGSLPRRRPSSANEQVLASLAPSPSESAPWASDELRSSAASTSSTLSSGSTGSTTFSVVRAEPPRSPGGPRKGAGGGGASAPPSPLLSGGPAASAGAGFGGNGNAKRLSTSSSQSADSLSSAGSDKFRIARPADAPTIAGDEGGHSSVFAGTNIRHCTPSQVISLLERERATPRGLRRALAYQPQDGDAICCAPEASGESIVTLMMQLISTRAVGVKETGDLAPICPSLRVPRLEGKAYDEDPAALDQLQPGKLRVYRTSMTCRAVQRSLGSKAKFVTVLRDPKDYRLSLYRRVLAMYEEERAGDRELPAFETRFPPSEFLPAAQAPFVHGFNGEATYEENVVDWIRAARSHPAHVHLVFYEDLVHDMATAMERLARFLGLELSPAESARSLKHLTHVKMAAHYPGQHEFNPYCLMTAVGEGARALSIKANRLLNQQWNQQVRSFGGAENYAALYSSCSEGRPFPYAFCTSPRGADSLSCLGLLVSLWRPAPGATRGAPAPGESKQLASSKASLRPDRETVEWI
jgi:hypothetical protein